MGNNIKVSVVVPVYNAESTIRKCFWSLENQTLKEIEIIFIDDGSKDNSFLVLQELCRLSEKAKVYTQKNAGPSYTRNRGIDLATGQFIMFCDSDDYVSEEWCEDLYNAGNSLIGVSICHLGKETIDGRPLWNNLTRYSFDSKISVEKIHVSNTYRIYSSQLLNSPCNKLFSAEVLKKYRIRFDEKISLGEDLLFNLCYLRAANIQYFYVVNKVLYYYVEANNDSLTNRYRPDYIEIQHKIFCELIDFLKKNGETEERVFSTLYYDYFFLVYNFFDDYMRHDKNNTLVKCKNLTSVLRHDDILQNAYKSCAFENDSRILVLLIKMRNYYLILLYKKGREWLKCQKK